MLYFLLLAISIDSFIISYTYGLKGVQLSILQRVKVAVTVGVVFYISMKMGTWLQLYLSLKLTEILGASLLILIGFSFILSALQPTKNSKFPLFSILKKPLKGDRDNSGFINGTEPFIIGLALSLDSMGTGISISLLGAQPLITSFSLLLLNILILSSGVEVGKHFRKWKKMNKLSILPGCLLVLFGVIKLVI